MEAVALKRFLSSELEELAMGDTADTKFEGNKSYHSFWKHQTFNMMIGLPSHNAVLSYNGKTMRLYRFTDKQEIKAISADGSAKSKKTIGN
jgi:hypothetical protein